MLSSREELEKPLVEVKEHKATGWTSKPRRVRYVIIPPHHLLEWLYDHVPDLPVPKDAVFHALGLDAREGILTLEFFSEISPAVQAVAVKLSKLTEVLRGMLTHHLPSDVRITGVHLSNVWTLMMLEMSSDRFMDVKEVYGFPEINVRYEMGELKITNPHLQSEEKIQTCGT